MLDDADIERLLDTALEQTFPASDPIAVSVTPPECDNCDELRRSLHLVEQLPLQRHAP